MHMELALLWRAHQVVVSVGSDADMKTNAIVDEKTKCICAFEIDSIYASITTIAKILAGVSGVSKIRLRKIFSRWEGVHIWFKYHEREFIVMEPYGDSSEYWIGPANAIEDGVDAGKLKVAFDEYMPSLLRRVVGGILSLNFNFRE